MQYINWHIFVRMSIIQCHRKFFSTTCQSRNARIIETCVLVQRGKNLVELPLVAKNKEVAEGLASKSSQNKSKHMVEGPRIILPDLLKEHALLVEIERCLNSFSLYIVLQSVEIFVLPSNSVNEVMLSYTPVQKV